MDRPLHIEDSKEGRCFHWYFDISRSCWNREGRDLLYRWSGGVAYVACFWKVFFFQKGMGFFGRKVERYYFVMLVGVIRFSCFRCQFWEIKRTENRCKTSFAYIYYIYIHIHIIFIYISNICIEKYLLQGIFWNLPGDSTFFSSFSSWVKELKHSMVNWLTQHISYQEQENPSEQGRKSARLLNTSLCSLNRLLRKLQVLLVILGPGLNLDGNSPDVDMFFL